MKKIVAMLVVLALVLPAAACALTLSDWMIWGSWNHCQSLKNGMLLTSIYLEEDGIAYYMTQMFRDGAPGVGRAFVGSWEIVSDRVVHVVIGNNSSMDLLYNNYNEMDDQATGDMYFRAELK